jgi:hypothetical protein
VEHSPVRQEGTEVPAQMVCRLGSCSQGPLDGGKVLGRADGTSLGPTHYLAWVTDTLPKQNSRYEYLVSFRKDGA